IDGPLPVVCLPASGSLFPLGSTVVSCATSDTRGNSSRASFIVRVVLPGDPPGAPCLGPTNCASGFCVDGVCCSTECAGGTNDCQACSTAAGGDVDGACTPFADGTACGDDGNLCSTDLCDGTSTVCQHAAGNGGVECAAAGPCENPGICLASSTACPGTTTIPNCTSEGIDPGSNVPVEVNGGLSTVGGALI